MVTDGHGIPLAFAITSARVHDLKPALSLMDQVRVPQRRGRPRQRPQRLVADKGYDAMPLRRALRERNIQPIIPRREWKGRRRRKGRPAGSFTAGRYQDRWKIERSHAWMDNERRVATRWDRTIVAFKAFVTLACIKISMNQL